MELRKEYQDIADSFGDSASSVEFVELVNGVALACQALADRPMKELTDAEISEIYKESTGGTAGGIAIKFASAIIAAFLKKQREPERVTIRAARHKTSGRIQAVQGDYINDDWEWLEPAQEFEVKLP